MLPVSLDQPPLLFLHIRKTAGCSVRNWLLNRFPVAGSLVDCHHVHNQPVDPSSFQFVTGHVDFDYLERFRQRPTCFVVLREPIERALSAYFFFQRNDAPFLRWLQETLPGPLAEERLRFTRRANELPLLEFLEREPDLARSWLGNVQSRCLLSRPAVGVRTDREMLEEATRNLGSCAVIGLTEQLGASLARLARQMGWDADGHAIPHDNAGVGRPQLDDIPARARAILAELNQVDLQLYKAAHRLFDAWQPPARGGRAPLPGGADFTFDQPLHGNGWYLREKSARGWFCWMGQDAWLDLKPETGGERTLELHVAHALLPALLEGLEVRVNGQALVARLRGNGESRVVEAIVPAQLLADPNRMRLSIAMREAIRPCDLVPGNPDTRRLGVAFDRIRLIPTRRAA